jgi:DNA-binding response OmpR family regulator
LTLLRHQAFWSGQGVDLTATEFSIVHGMAQYPDRLFTRDQIMTMAHGASTYRQRPDDRQSYPQYP